MSTYPEQPGFAANPVPSADPAATRRYNRLLRRIGVVDAALGLLLMALLLATGWTAGVRNFAFRLAPVSHWLALFIYTAALMLMAKAVGLGLEYYSFRIEHRYHLSTQRPGSWVWDQIKSFLVSMVFAQLLVQVMYYLIRWQPHWWWVTCWALFLMLSVLLVQLAPLVLFPLFFRFRRLENEELAARLAKMSERSGARVRGVYEWILSEKTRKANAALMGLGGTRRIVISDTMLASCDAEEIEAVVAHELGHHVYRHMLTGILFQAVITFFGFWCLKLVVRWAEFAGLYAQIDFANLPLIVLVATVISLALLPVMNAFSRFNERQADLYAWKTLGRIEPFCSAMEKLAVQNLSERDPSRWVEALFHSHPCVGRRIRAAQEWAARRVQSQA
ncbi:MAG: M48 family metallopeptidase [Acidobacteriota bacterium]|nr:M48 family metallopeptidase [Acidobacteriota bacterium]